MHSLSFKYINKLQNRYILFNYIVHLILICNNIIIISHIDDGILFHSSSLLISLFCVGVPFVIRYTTFKENINYFMVSDIENLSLFFPISLAVWEFVDDELYTSVIFILIIQVIWLCSSVIVYIKYKLVEHRY